ncbi:MAG: galactose mutarotase [Prevotella sp.]|nr:galactose mutarotase [Prevotella sp.]
MKALKSFILGAGMAMAVLAACTPGGNCDVTLSGLEPAKFDTTINEKKVQLFALKNKNGVEVCVTNFGARVVSILVPDRENKLVDVVLGYDNIAQYADTVNNASDFGAAIGRYANRINQGIITVGGKQIQLPKNNGPHCLHGGFSGWQYQVYEGNQVDDQTLKLTLHSPDGDNNFPGNVDVTVTYTLKDDNTLDMTFEGTTDAETVLNMTNHAYFNLNGDPSVPGTDMELYVNADNFTPSDSTFMTTGEIKPVEGTPMDYRKPKTIKEGCEADYDQIKNARGLDHNWVLNTYKDGKGDDTTVAASVYSPKTGIFMEVYTNEPGIQIYSGNFLDGSKVGKKGIAYPKQASICLESQKYPDSPNKKDWPSPWLKPGEKYYSHVAYKFSVKK